MPLNDEQLKLIARRLKTDELFSGKTAEELNSWLYQPLIITTTSNVSRRPSLHNLLSKVSDVALVKILGWSNLSVISGLIDNGDIGGLQRCISLLGLVLTLSTDDINALLTELSSQDTVIEQTELNPPIFKLIGLAIDSNGTPMTMPNYIELEDLQAALNLEI